MIPESLTSHIQEQTGQAITGSRRASGGSINQAALIELEGAGTCFLKWNTGTDADLFVKEVKGLELLSSAGTNLVVPEVIHQDIYAGRNGYLLLEYLKEGSAGSTSAEDFGRELAAQHRVTEKQFGLDHNNYIGKLPQYNDWHNNWVDFFIQQRMEPQLKMALDSGKFSSGTRASFERMYKRLPEIFPEEPPSLLHGDLWSGNYFFNAEGNAAVYDPAVYYGHREMELAFTHMFGGFSSGFYRAYEEEWPLESGFSGRKEIYNVYPLLVHTNLFGGHYGQQVKSIVRQF